MTDPAEWKVQILLEGGADPNLLDETVRYFYQKTNYESKVINFCVAGGI
jgi:hypothetical protein